MAFDTFEIIGSLVAINSDKLKGFESKTSDNGYNTKTCRFNVKSGTNMIMVQTKGTVKVIEKDGKIKVSPDQVIYSRSKGDANNKGENIQIPFADRKKESVIENVAAFKKLIIDDEIKDDRNKIWAIRKALANGDSLTDEQFKFLGVTTVDEAEETIKSRARHEYLHEWDYADALNKLVNSANGLYKVSGNVDISYDMTTKTAYKNYTVTKVEKMPDDSETHAYVSMDVFFNKDSIDLESWVEEDSGKRIPNISGTAVVNGKQMFYFKDKRYDVTGTFATDVAFEIPGIAKNYGIKNRFTKSFDDVTWKVIRLNLNIIDGTEEVELTEDMLTEDQLIDIECGATTLEEIKADMNGKIYGDRVRKYTFRSLTNQAKEEEDTEFTDEDMLPPHSEAADELESDDEDIFDDDDI